MISICKRFRIFWVFGFFLFFAQFSFSFPEVADENVHLYLLVGQSNMAGRGVPSKIDKTPHPRVYVVNKENEWEPAADPLHFDKPTVVGVGPGLAFGKAMAEANPNAAIVLIPCAAGGSPISSWTPGGYHKQTDSHPSDDAIERCRKAMKRRGTLKGILWHQGESDSNATDGLLYKDRLRELIERLRKELHAPDAPFIAGGLAESFVQSHPDSKYIHEAILALSKELVGVSWASAEGLKCKEDGVHFNSESARELGRRYAREMIRLQKETSK